MQSGGDGGVAGGQTCIQVEFRAAHVAANKVLARLEPRQEIMKGGPRQIVGRRAARWLIHFFLVPEGGGF